VALYPELLIKNKQTQILVAIKARFNSAGLHGCVIYSAIKRAFGQELAKMDQLPKRVALTFTPKMQILG
jgi:hypothetical protein